MSLSFYLNDQRRISSPHPMHFESVFLRVCEFKKVMAELGMEISNNDSLFMGIEKRKILAKFYRIKTFELIILAF